MKFLHPTVAYIQVDVIPLNNIVDTNGTIPKTFEHETRSNCNKLVDAFERMGYVSFVNRTDSYGECEITKPIIPKDNHRKSRLNVN